MSKILILKGLPASGKSTYAKKLVMEQNYVRVNKDDLRAMMNNSRFSKSNEKLIVSVRDLIIVEALSAQRNVVVDDTNLNPVHETQIRKLVESFKPTVEIKNFDIDPELAIKRDLERDRSVGKDVIMSMYRKWLKPTVEPYKQPEGKPEAIIVDIDGTLAHMTDRSPYEWHKVASDEVDPVVLDVIEKYIDNTNIILLSGRDSACRDITEQWLADNNVPYSALFMRDMGDMRDDRIVKKELFDEHIRGKYRIPFVLDDRDKVVDMWRNDVGLKVLQVAEGDF